MGRLSIILEGDIVRRAFSKNPTKATFKRKILGSDEEVKPVPIVYRD